MESKTQILNDRPPCCLTPCSDKITKGPSSKNWGFYNHNALSVYTGRNKIVKLNVSTFTETLTIIVCISIQIEKKRFSVNQDKRNQRVYFSSNFSYLTAAKPVWRWENSHVLSDCCWQHHHELVCPEWEREREREREVPPLTVNVVLRRSFNFIIIKQGEDDILAELMVIHC